MIFDFHSFLLWNLGYRIIMTVEHLNSHCIHYTSSSFSALLPEISFHSPFLIIPFLIRSLESPVLSTSSLIVPQQQDFFLSEKENPTLILSFLGVFYQKDEDKDVTRAVVFDRKGLMESLYSESLHF